MRARELPLADQLEAGLMAFHAEETPLRGIVPVENRLALIGQLIDSIRRVRYVEVIRDMEHSSRRADPADEMFDPLKAAALFKRSGNTEEAFWLVFLATHCGKHLQTGWQLSRELYGALGDGSRWTWERTSGDLQGFRDWLADNWERFDGMFGNHRKYESLKPTANGTGAVVASYVNWITSIGSHVERIDDALDSVDNDPRRAFAYLYRSMKSVRRFGRIGRFDYLTMLAKLQLAAIQADSAYMAGATGPLRGAKLLFDGDIRSRAFNAVTLDRHLQRLDTKLNVGMQVLEDAICNWQKSPNRYKPFRG